VVFDCGDVSGILGNYTDSLTGIVHLDHPFRLVVLIACSTSSQNWKDAFPPAVPLQLAGGGVNRIARLANSFFCQAGFPSPSVPYGQQLHSCPCPPGLRGELLRPHDFVTHDFVIPVPQPQFASIPVHSRFRMGPRIVNSASLMTVSNCSPQRGCSPITTGSRGLCVARNGLR